MVILTSEGARIPGFSHDFAPGKSRFHLSEIEPSGEVAETHTLELDDVHAVFFVRDFAFGRERRYTEEDAPREPPSPPLTGGLRIRVTCEWGEKLEGLTYGYEQEGSGFFVFPTEPRERVYNLERAFLTRNAVKSVEMPSAA